MMGRVKTRMEFITSDKKRKSVFETRSKCIKKKAYELSTLCAVNVGLIITDSDTSSSSVPKIKTHTWPTSEDDQMFLDNMIASYKCQDLVQRERRNTNVTHFLGKDETRQYPTSTLEDWKYDGMSEQELRKLATFLDSKVEKVKERIQYLKKGKQVSSTSTNQPDLIDIDDENKGENVFSMNQPQLVDIDSDDGADLTYMLGQILDNPMTPTTDDLPLHDSGIDLGILWSDDLLLVDPTTNSSSTDISYPINMQSRHQLIVTTPDFQPAITQYPNELQSFSYYLNKPPPPYFDAPIFCQPLEPHINTSSISHLNSNSSVWSMPLLS